MPALDAVLFMSPRNSQVDIVQAVGRAMRKAEGKGYGYIVLPVAVPAGVEPAAVLDHEERFAAVWSVLRALRSHDDRLEAEINQIDLNNEPTGRIIFGGGGTGEGNGKVSRYSRFRRWTCRPGQSTPGSSTSAATGSTGRPGRRTWRPSSHA